jgi:hypothetical protein
MSDSESSTGGVILVIMAIVQLAPLIPSILRRRRQPIKARRPWLYFITPIASICAVIFTSFRYFVPSFPCGPYYILLHTANATCVVATLVRLAFMYYAFDLNSRSLDIQDRRRKEKNGGGTTMSIRGVSTDESRTVAVMENIFSERPASPSLDSFSMTPVPTFQKKKAERSAKNPTEFSIDEIQMQVERLHFLKMRKRLTNKFLAYAILCGTMVILIVEIIFFSVKNFLFYVPRNSNECVNSVGEILSFYSVVMFILLCIVLEFVRRVSKIDDTFKLSTEFKISQMSAIPFIICLIWVGIFNKSTVMQLVTAWVTVSFQCIFCTAFVAYVLYQTYQPQFAEESDLESITVNGKAVLPGSRASPRGRQSVQEQGGLEDFRVLVENSAGLEMFQQHLLKELSVENIMFWNSINEYKLLTSEEDNQVALKKKAMQLFRTYIPLGAPIQVNISYHQVSQIQQILGLDETKHEATLQELKTLFDVAQKEIFVLMARDSFQRFKHTQNYKDWKKKTALDETGNLIELKLV